MIYNLFTPTVGPHFLPGSMEQAFRLGGPFFLLCGTNLMSNPAATSQWRDNEGNVVDGSSGYTFGINVTGIWLNSPTTQLNNRGIWRCTVEVVGINVTLSDNRVVPSLMTGRATNNISLIIVGKLKLSRSGKIYCHFIFTTFTSP